MRRIECFIQKDLFAEPFEGVAVSCNIPMDTNHRLAFPERLLTDLALSTDPAGGQPLLISCRWRDRDGEWLGVPHIGMNAQIARALDITTGNAGVASQQFSRLIRTLGELHAGIDASEFDAVLVSFKFTRGFIKNVELTRDDWEKIVLRYAELYEIHTGVSFPQDPVEQLRQVIELSEAFQPCSGESQCSTWVT